NAQLHSHHLTTFADLEQRAENIYSSLLYLQLQSLGVSDVNADHAASHVGKAAGIADCIKRLIIAVQNKDRKQREIGFLDVPSILLAKYGISTERILRKGPSNELSDVIFELAILSNDHLALAKELEDTVPTEAIPGLLIA
ncbi:NADH dehydrogenase (ubiquinone) complex I, assembly factor 6, partial [Nowakowskiella sp. JEL0078]